MGAYYNRSGGGGGFGFNIGMTPGVKALLIANVGIFVLGVFVPASWDLVHLLGLVPALVVRGFLWQPFTYLFLHGSPGHILFNMLALWMFGTVLEGTWGRRRFLQFYTICGVGAGICVVLAAYLFGSPIERTIPTIGASGAIFGLLLAFGIMYPNAPILLFFILPIPAKYFVIIMGAIEFLMASSGSGGPVSHIAHLGGLLVAFLYMRQQGFLRRGYSYASGSSYRSARSWWSPFTGLFSVNEWRMAYNRWQRQRMKRKFEVYMRDRNRHDHDNIQ